VTWWFQPHLINVGDLSPYVEDKFEYLQDSRSNPLKEGKIDADAFKVQGTTNARRVKGLSNTQQDVNLTLHYKLTN